MPARSAPRRALLLLALLGLAPCPARAADAASAAAPAPAPPPSPEAALKKEVESVAADIAAARDLSFKRPISVIKMTAGQAQRLLAEELDRDLPPADAEPRVRLLAIVGLLPERYPLREKLLDILGEQVAGFYTPRNRQLVVVDQAAAKIEKAGGAGADMFPVILAHELDHALTDQNFDLLRLVENASLHGQDDVLLAHQALAEGDAMLTMLLFMFRRAGLTPTPDKFPSAASLRKMTDGLGPGLYPQFGSAPPYIQEQLLEPYALGLELVLGAWKSGGWRAVDALWKSPPQSTEQLLHPERRSDAPVDVGLKDVPEGWRVVTSLQLGELGCRLWLGEKLSADETNAAAAGWDGDRLALLERPRATRGAATDAAEAPETAAFLSSAWDSAQDAGEFAAAAEKWLRATAQPRDDWRIEQRGKDVLLFFEPAFAPESSITPLDKDPWARPPSPLKNE